MTKPNPPARKMVSIKCGHCHGYHMGARGVWFCQFGPHAQVNQAAVAANARVDAPTPAPVVIPWQLKTPQAMVDRLHEGRYASRPDQSVPFTFFRVWRPKSGKRKGCTLVRTQHSDTYMDALVIFPSGKSYHPNAGERFDTALMIACADPITSSINYGREKGVCSTCGKTLTDERSRYYGIGPECEKKGNGPGIIARVNAATGEYYPGII